MPAHDFRLHPPDARLLEERRALVTGATSGIGQGTAFVLAAHGAAVAINHRGKVDDWRAMAAAIEAAGRRADETEGAIVMISSVHEVIPWEQFSHYCASKGGMKLFAQSIAKELAPHGIRVVSVAPGAIATPINEEVLDDPTERGKVEAEIPLGRWGEVSDVAQAVAWVASAQARYVVGATLFVDGGMTLYPNFV